MTRISKGASDTDAFRTPALFYNSAREGFGDLLANLDLSSGEGVLLPAFIGWSPREGSGMFDPVAGSGLPFGFYEPEPDLTVNIERLEIALATGRWRVLVLIHYWGRTDPRLAAVQSLAKAHGAILIEDLAHGLFTAARGAAGWAGSINLFSLHKMLPLSEGGMITYRNTALLKGQRETRPDLSRAVQHYDWATIGEVRRTNFQRLIDRLSTLPELGSDYELLWPELAPHDVPQSLPVRILNGRRDSIYTAMNIDGYGMTSLYHTLIAELASFPAMQSLAASVTNFPIHQDSDVAELDSMIDSFQRALSG